MRGGIRHHIDHLRYDNPSKSPHIAHADISLRNTGKATWTAISKLFWSSQSCMAFSAPPCSRRSLTLPGRRSLTQAGTSRPHLRIFISALPQRSRTFRRGGAENAPLLLSIEGGAVMLTGSAARLKTAPCARESAAAGYIECGLAGVEGGSQNGKCDEGRNASKSVCLL